MGTPGANGNPGAMGNPGANGSPGAMGSPGSAANIPGLIAFYRGAGVDLSGNGHNATVTGTIPLVADRFGMPAVAASFTGASAYLSVTLAQLPVGTAPRTVSLWFTTTSAFSSPSGALFNTGTAMGPNGERFGALVSATHDYFVGQGADLTGTKVVNDGNWHNLVVTFDGTTVTLWVDAFYSVSGTPTLNTVGQNLVIGATVTGTNAEEPFNGAIDDLRVYNRVLTRDERGLLFSEGGWH